MERHELIELINLIQSGNNTDEEVSQLLTKLKKNVPDPRVSNYIFQKEYENLTPEEIIDKALNYKPFYL